MGEKITLATPLWSRITFYVSSIKGVGRNSAGDINFIYLGDTHFVQPIEICKRNRIALSDIGW